MLAEDKRKVVVQVRMSPDMIAALDAIAASSADGADRSQIIRQFVADGLAARGKGKRS